MDDFRVLRFVTLDQYENKIEIDFIDKNKNYNGLLTTLIIGPNGTRKSSLISLITDIFRELDDWKKLLKEKTSKILYELTYIIDEKDFRVKNTKEGITFYQNAEKININKLQLPQRVLAVSFMVNDKFTFNNPDDNNNNDIYRYLGVRQASNITFINTLVKKIVDRIINNSSNSRFLEKLQNILSFLDIEEDIEIVFEPKRNKTLFTKGISNKDIETMTNTISNQVSFRSDKIRNFSENDILEISEFINEINNNTLSNNHRIEINNRSSLCYNLNLNDSEKNLSLINDYPTLQKLFSLGYIQTPTLRFRRDDKMLDFEGTSSGEKHFLFTMISMASEIKDYSLICIDEPEISLHPNWQIKYISCFKEIFSDYPSCHVLIATHSHFMISDLEAESSSIVSLTRTKENKILANLHDENTFGWSVEDILYNIFGVITTRNLFVAKEVDSVLEKISKGNELNRDDLKTLNYIKSNMNINDPLYGVLTMISSRFEI